MGLKIYSTIVVMAGRYVAFTHRTEALAASLFFFAWTYYRGIRNVAEMYAYGVYVLYIQIRSRGQLLDSIKASLTTAVYVSQGGACFFASEI